MRYVIALVLAALLIGGIVLYIRQTNSIFGQTMRLALLKQQQADTLPPELQGMNLQTADLSQLGDFNITLPANLEQRVKLSLWLTDFWYIWGPLVAVICLGGAALFGPITKPER